MTMTRSRSRPVRVCNWGNTLTGAFNAAVMVTRMREPRRILVINSNWFRLRWLFDQLRIERPLQDRDASEQQPVRPRPACQGCAIIHNSTKSDLVPTGNVWDDNGQPATIKKGA